jgi:hypothetical protein
VARRLHLQAHTLYSITCSSMGSPAVELLSVEVTASFHVHRHAGGVLIVFFARAECLQPAALLKSDDPRRH